MTSINNRFIELSGTRYTLTELKRSDDEYLRLEAVEQFFELAEFIQDDSVLVRCAVARKRIGHEYLIDDLDWRVRATVAKHCVDLSLLDRLAHDNHDFVRFVVVKRGHALEYLANDSDEEIAAIARYSLEYSHTI